MRQWKEKKTETIRRIKGSRLGVLYYKLHVSELTGIVTSFIMMVITFIPVITNDDEYQITVALFFLEMLLIRLILFIWYHKTKKSKRAKLLPAVMMLLTAIVVLLTRSIFISAVVYQLVVNHKYILSDYTLLAIAYGIYTFGKIGLAVYGLIQKRKINPYMETLSYLGWISAVYTLALFTNYLILACSGDDLTWMKVCAVILMAITTIVLIVMMLVKSIKSILAYRRHQKQLQNKTNLNR